MWRTACREMYKWRTACRALYKVVICLGQWGPLSHWHMLQKCPCTNEVKNTHDIPMQTQWRSYTFLTLVPGGGGWSAPDSICFTPQETPNTHCAGGWVCLTAGLEGMEILASTGNWSPTLQPVASSCTDCYPGHSVKMMIEICKGKGQSVAGCLASVLHCQFKKLKVVLVCALSIWSCLWNSVIQLQ
jgi:hypothetical protein